MDRFDIYDAQVLWSGCDDRRPWLIVETTHPDKPGCFPISGQCYRGTPFFISESHADFKGTGLRKSCFIHDETIVEIAAGMLIRRRGKIENDMLKSFRAHSGI